MRFSWLVARTVRTSCRIKARANDGSDDSLRCRSKRLVRCGRRSFSCAGNSVRLGGSDEEGSGRQLEGGDGTVGVGEAGLEMGKDLCCCGPMGGAGWELGRWTASQQSRADGGLAAVESLPDALEGPVTPRAVDGLDGSGDGAGDGVLEERQQSSGGQAEASDLVGKPDAEGPSATRSQPTTVAAKDASRSECSLWWVAVVEPGENAVAVECADSLAVWTWGLFEAFGDLDPLFLAAVEPSLVAHVQLPSRMRRRRC